MRIWSPNLAYCPQTTRSALLKSATRWIVSGSSTVEEEMRRSVKIWCRLVRADRAQAGRLAHVGAQHFGEAGAQPVETGVARRIAKGQDASERRRRSVRLVVGIG